jgi:putative tricarboxylic transport membrane protein
MEILNNLVMGFGVAATPVNLMYCFIGTLLGTFIGVLPGIGPTATIAMLLPLTYYLSPTASLIMLAGIYYGSQYGGSTTAILVNLPGEVSSSVTAIDGYQLARKGKAGTALSIAAIGSFVAGTFATLLIAVFALPLTSIALQFGSAEYFSLIILGFIAATALAHGSIVKAFAMIIAGMLFGMIGTDTHSGAFRFTMGIVELRDSLSIVAVALGIFGIVEVLRNLETLSETVPEAAKITTLWPSREDARRSVWPIIRGSVIGSLLGILPGGGSILSAFTAYAVEKRISKHPEEFGKGAIEGVAAPESANNAGAQTSFIPLLTLGIPSHALMALMIGAMMIQGITPGPRVVVEQPELFWGVIASMWLGNLMLIVLNLPLIGLWVSLLRVPYGLMFPAIVLFCCIGTYSITNNVFDVWVMLLFGVLGVFFHKVGAEPAPFVLGFILGPLMEENFRRAMYLSRGDALIFLQRPISAFLLILALALLVILVLPAVQAKRAEVFRE